MDALHIWDISDKSTYLKNIGDYNNDANTACLVYDITNRDSFEECIAWADELKGKVENIVIVGNKIDLKSERKVTTEEAAQFAILQGFRFHEVSAAQNIGINELVQDLGI